MKKPLDCTVHGQTLEVVDGSMYLGVTLTDNLSWSKHVSDTAGKAHGSLGFLRRNLDKSKQQPTLLLLDQSWSMHLLCGIPIAKLISRLLNKSRAGQLVICTTTIHLVHKSASQTWSTSFQEDARFQD